MITPVAATPCSAAAVVRRTHVGILTALGGVVFAAALLLSLVVAVSSGAQASTAVRGVDLLRNPGADAGAASVRGWDAVTIPGWQIVSGLPTVVRYGARGFPPVSEDTGGAGTDQLFAGGAGGTARLDQLVPIKPASRSGVTGLRYHLSGRLGGMATSSASVKVTFLSKSGRTVGQTRIGPVGGTEFDGGARLVARSKSGPLPAATVAAQVELVLASAADDYDGPHAPFVGYNRAVADDLDLSLSAPVAPPPRLVPPAAKVPRFDHVFLIYFENEDFDQIVGNTSQAPYFNRLIPRGSLLANFFAEEHPSDGNYLAFAGGSTFGIPLNDPLEENPQYTISARNIGDLVEAAHETWAGFLQSADGPCDDTVHGYYWDDDIPMLYFKDVRERPAYCADHLPPLAAFQPDLRSAATTPNFSWIGPDDCSDMEACGIRAGDEFLQQIASEIFRSPAWTRQRSLLIVTFDEDSYNEQRPAQRVPTLVLGSRGVRAGYVSTQRYTHYSLLRTVEAALGLGTLTRNDKYATALNDVFTTR
jgi:hypothetical protein